MIVMVQVLEQGGMTSDADPVAQHEGPSPHTAADRDATPRAEPETTIIGAPSPRGGASKPRGRGSGPAPPAIARLDVYEVRARSQPLAVRPPPSRPLSSLSTRVWQASSSSVASVSGSGRSDPVIASQQDPPVAPVAAPGLVAAVDDFLTVTYIYYIRCELWPRSPALQSPSRCSFV